MASVIARGRVRTTTTTTVESRKMAAILQIIGWQRHAALVYCVLLWYWTSMLWSTDTCQNKVSADQYHVTISRAQVDSSSRSSVFWSWSLTRCWFFDWIAGTCLVNLLKTGQGCSGSQWMLTQNQTYPKLQLFLLCKCFCCVFRVYGDYWNSKQKAKQYTENLGAKLQNSIQNSTFSWVSLIGLWTTRYRSYAFRLA